MPSRHRVVVVTACPFAVGLQLGVTIGATAGSLAGPLCPSLWVVRLLVVFVGIRNRQQAYVHDVPRRGIR